MADRASMKIWTSLHRWTTLFCAPELFIFRGSEAVLLLGLSCRFQPQGKPGVLLLLQLKNFNIPSVSSHPNNKKSSTVSMFTIMFYLHTVSADSSFSAVAPKKWCMAVAQTILQVFILNSVPHPVHFLYDHIFRWVAEERQRDFDAALTFDACNVSLRQSCVSSISIGILSDMRIQPCLAA
jgi:hypothetical protein